MFSTKIARFGQVLPNTQTEFEITQTIGIRVSGKNYFHERQTHKRKISRTIKEAQYLH